MRPPLPTPRSRRRRHDGHRRGIALIIVLGFVALFGVVATMMIAASRVSRINAKVLVDRSRARYAAESAAGYATWMMICDRRRYRNRRLGVPSLERDELGAEPGMEPWMADGKKHVVGTAPDFAATVQILDADRGWDFSGNLPSRRLRAKPHFRVDVEDDPERAEQQAAFFDSLDDYTDGDEFVRLHGIERDGYEAIRQENEGLPRNRPMRFREEAYWIPGISIVIDGLSSRSYTTALPDDAVRVVPPTGVRFPAKPSFFSASPEMMSAYASLSYDELQTALEARRSWYEEALSVQDTLGEIYGKVAAAMSFAETGVITVRATAASPGSEIHRRTVTTIDLRSLVARGQPVYLMLWQRVVF